MQKLWEIYGDLWRFIHSKVLERSIIRRPFGDETNGIYSLDIEIKESACNLTISMSANNTGDQRHEDTIPFFFFNTHHTQLWNKSGNTSSARHLSMSLFFSFPLLLEATPIWQLSWKKRFHSCRILNYLFIYIYIYIYIYLYLYYL